MKKSRNLIFVSPKTNIEFDKRHADVLDAVRNILKAKNSAL